MSNIATGAVERKASSQRPENSTDGGLPSGLDPERHRIILQHWFGVGPDAASVDTVAMAA